jgi:hypothetical protein
VAKLSAETPAPTVVDDASDRAWGVQDSGTATFDTVDSTPSAIAGRDNDAVLQAAFERLGESEGVNTPWLADYSRRGAEAMPLLILLAVERIAARNSRRSGAMAANAESSP